MTAPDTTDPRSPAAAPRRRSRRAAGIAALLGAFAIGAGTTAAALHGRQATVVALTPAPIAAMRDGSPVAVKGRVAEVFGNKFIIADDGGRALVDTGRAGDGADLVTAAETVTVQGRFERGFVHAAAVIHADGRSDLVGPPGPPPPGGVMSWGGPEGRLPHWLARHLPRNG